MWLKYGCNMVEMVVDLVSGLYLPNTVTCAQRPASPEPVPQRLCGLNPGIGPSMILDTIPSSGAVNLAYWARVGIVQLLWVGLVDSWLWWYQLWQLGLADQLLCCELPRPPAMAVLLQEGSEMIAVNVYQEPNMSLVTNRREDRALIG